MSFLSVPPEIQHNQNGLGAYHVPIGSRWKAGKMKTEETEADRTSGRWTRRDATLKEIPKISQNTRKQTTEIRQAQNMKAEIFPSMEKTT